MAHLGVGLPNLTLGMFMARLSKAKLIQAQLIQFLYLILRLGSSPWLGSEARAGSNWEIKTPLYVKYARPE